MLLLETLSMLRFAFRLLLTYGLLKLVLVLIPPVVLIKLWS